MFSTCSELTPRAPIPDGRMERIMQPCLTSHFVNKSTNSVGNSILSHVKNSQILKKPDLTFCEQDYLVGYQFNFIPCEQFSNIENIWPHILWTRFLTRLAIYFYPMWTIQKYWGHLAQHFVNKIINSVGSLILSHVNRSQILRHLTL